jgi:hypothetical protein
MSNYNLAISVMELAKHCKTPGVASICRQMHTLDTHLIDPLDLPDTAEAFGACLNIVDFCIGWRSRLYAMAAVSEAWRDLHTHWDHLEQLFLSGSFGRLESELSSIITPHKLKADKNRGLQQAHGKT